MKRMLQDGNEMGEGIMFPGNLNKEKAVQFTSLLLDVFDLFHKENIEVQIRHCFDNKGLEWNIKTFYFDKGFCLDKTYTFILLPNWGMTPFYEHSFSNNMIPLCKKVINSERDETELNKRMAEFLDELKLYYQQDANDETNSFLIGEDWKVIFAKSFKTEQVANAEKRIQNYLQFLKDTRISPKEG